jgi:putative solute:sodium symporter small subunit
MSYEIAEAQRSHWRATRALTIVVLLLWVLFGFMVPWFAKELDQFEFLDFPLGYYMVVQGSLFAFVIMIFVQNWIQDAIDDKYGVSED